VGAPVGSVVVSVKTARNPFHLGATTPRDALPFLIVQLSDPFAGFVLELGEKSGHVLKRVSVLLGLQQ
jgi:hypothetical protein